MEQEDPEQLERLKAAIAEIRAQREAAERLEQKKAEQEAMQAQAELDLLKRALALESPLSKDAQVGILVQYIVDSIGSVSVWRYKDHYSAVIEHADVSSEGQTILEAIQNAITYNRTHKESDMTLEDLRRAMDGN